MKVITAFLALVTLLFASASLHADPIVTFNAAAGDVTLVHTDLLGVDSWVYTDVNVTAYDPGTPLPLLPGLATTTEVFTATFADILGANVLNITDICANVDVNAPATACTGGAFTFTDASLGNAINLGVLGDIGANLNANVVGIDVAASIGGGSGSFGFGAPPNGGGDGGNSPSPVPEPASLSLMATGLLGAAGALRRRFVAARA